jgi:nicotinamidase-related amidase
MTPYGVLMPDHPITITPSSSMLLVMDYQPVVLEPMPDSAELLKHAAQAIELVRRIGGHVGYVRVAFEDTDYDAIPATNKAFSALAASRYLKAESPESAIHEDVAPQAGDIVVRKTRVGPFLTTNLDQRLRTRGIDTLILAGVHTSGVVLTTVRDGADRDYRLFVLEDCVSDPDPSVHATLMQKVFPRQAHLTTVFELSNLFEAS